jgi:hypothetical protein
MTWRGNRDITWPKIEFCAVFHPCAKAPGNDVGKMGSLAILRPYDRPHMLGPPPARFPGRSHNRHIAKIDEFHLDLRGCACFIWCIETLLLGC